MHLNFILPFEALGVLILLGGLLSYFLVKPIGKFGLDHFFRDSKLVMNSKLRFNFDKHLLSW